jgi:hypothetical protein
MITPACSSKLTPLLMKALPVSVTFDAFPKK